MQLFERQVACHGLTRGGVIYSTPVSYFGSVVRICQVRSTNSPEPSPAEKFPFAHLGLVMSLVAIVYVALCPFLGLDCSTLYGTEKAFRRLEHNDQLLPSLQIILSFSMYHQLLCCIQSLQTGREVHMYRHTYCSPVIPA